MLPHVLYRAPFYSSLYLEKLLWTLPMGMLTCIVSLGTLTTIPFPSRGAGGSGSPRRSLGGGTGPSPAIHSALLPSPPRCEAQPVAPAVKLQGAERAWLCAGSGQRYRSHCPLGFPRPQPPASRAACSPWAATDRTSPADSGQPPDSHAESEWEQPQTHFCGRVTWRAVKHAARPAVSPGAARKFPSARGRHYFPRSGISGVGAAS